MKRSAFESLFGKLGLSMGPYQNAAYYGAGKNFSLVLTPFASDDVARAKLAVNAPEREKKVVVNTFLSAAKLDGISEIAKAAESGLDFRGRVGDKEVTMTSIGTELVLNVQT